MNKIFVSRACAGVLVVLVLVFGSRTSLEEKEEGSFVEKTSSEVAGVEPVATESDIETTEVTEGDIVIGEDISDRTAEVSPVETQSTIPARSEIECLIIDDFAGESSLRWFTVNDGVMGGLSQGAVSYEGDTLVHAGVLNTNGGGFSYAGARLPEDILVGYSRLQIRLNTNGRQYALNFGDERNWRISHQAEIPLGLGDSWQEVFVEFDQTVPTVFSRQVESDPFDAGAIDELNFILGDGLDGPFRMEVDWIKTCV